MKTQHSQEKQKRGLGYSSESLEGPGNSEEQQLFERPRGFREMKRINVVEALGNSGVSLGRLLRGGRLTVSILRHRVALLGLLVRVTLDSCGKQLHLGRKKANSGVRGPEALPSDHHLVPAPPSSTCPSPTICLYPLAWALVATLGHEEENPGRVRTERGV